MLNRIILIGNGFDLAHGLTTGYKNFIDNYWANVSKQIFPGYKPWRTKQYRSINNPRPYKDEFISFKVFRHRKYKTKDPSYPQSCYSPYDEVRKFIAILNDFNTGNYDGSVLLTFKNKFFEHISIRCSLINWVDIENEYYEKLKELLAEDDAVIRNEKVLALNQDFDAIKKRLESFLIQIVNETQIESFQSIKKAFRSLIDMSEVAIEKRKMFVDSILNNIGGKDVVQLDKEKEPNCVFCHSQDEERTHYVVKHLPDKHFQKTHCALLNTLILNFNYTNTADLYIHKGSKYKVNHIHGELDNEYNPIIFGYGDELDEDYKKISNLNDNNYLKNIKSIRYLETENYRNLLAFIDSAPFQIYIMGHSCGNSDRTLLNTLFEHKNCISIKPFYHQKDDGTDNYIEIIQNISRNFNDMRLMRDRVVNKTYCRPLVPRQEQKSKRENL